MNDNNKPKDGSINVIEFNGSNSSISINPLNVSIKIINMKKGKILIFVVDGFGNSIEIYYDNKEENIKIVIYQNIINKFESIKEFDIINKYKLYKRIRYLF